jgi:hypothetical protein
MAMAIARVELHYASEADYSTLHASMEREGFQRIVQANDGAWYHLPTGTYVHYSVTSPTDASQRASRAVATTKRASAIFVGGWDGSWASNGLLRAN